VFGLLVGFRPGPVPAQVKKCSKSNFENFPFFPLKNFAVHLSADQRTGFDWQNAAAAAESAGPINSGICYRLNQNQRRQDKEQAQSGPSVTKNKSLSVAKTRKK
jgi:hypothetical protein